MSNAYKLLYKNTTMYIYKNSVVILLLYVLNFIYLTDYRKLCHKI